MGQITQDGFDFDSGWIDANIAKFKDQSELWAVRRDRLAREIAMREEDLKSMLHPSPDDLAGHAHTRAYLAALRHAEEELTGEIFERRGGLDGAPKRPYRRSDGIWVVEYLHQGEVRYLIYAEESAAQADFSKLLQMFDPKTSKYGPAITGQGPVHTG